jgi:hypothetical protein
MQTHFAPQTELTEAPPRAERDAPSHVWMFWVGIAASTLGALVILLAAAGLPVFDHAWSIGFVVASPLLGVVWFLDLVGVGLAYENWRSLAIEITGGAVLCMLGAAMIAAHHAREHRAGRVTKMSTMPSNP